MTIQQLYEKMRPSRTHDTTGQILADGLSVNISDFFTRLIKDAARCNSYSSDIYYSLREIDEKVRSYRGIAPFEPIFVGFRRHGVDGNTFILSRLDGNPYNASREYFALYSVNVIPEDGGGWCKVLFNEYWM